MSFSSPEQRQTLCDSLAGPFRKMSSSSDFDAPMIISFLTVLLMPALIRYLVLGVVFVRGQKPEADVGRQGPAQYELAAIEDGNDPPPPHLESQSSTTSQIPEGIATAGAAASAATMPSQAVDAGDPEGADDTKPLPSTPRRKDYLILAACTLFAIVDVMALFVIGFGFQFYLYCDTLEENGIIITSQRNAGRAFVLWIAFALLVAWVSSDIMCLRLMVKDLWDGQARRHNADEQEWTHIGLMILLGAAAVPISIALLLVLLFAIAFIQCWLYLRQLFGFPQTDDHNHLSRLGARLWAARQPVRT